MSEEAMEIFIQETRKCIESMTKNLLEFERDPKNIEALNEIFRSAHTLKGSSGMMELTDIQELTHKMEDVLDKVLKGLISSSPDLIDVLFECIDALEEKMESLERGENKELDFSHLMKKLEELISDGEDISFQKKKVYALSKEELEEIEKEFTLIKNRKDGKECFIVIVKLDKDCFFKAARAYMIIRNLQGVSKIIRCFPDVKIMENGEFDDVSFMVLITANCREEIQKLIKQIPEVDDVKVEKIENLKELFKYFSIKQFQTKEKGEEKEARLGVNIGSLQAIKVSTKQLDELMNLIGELIVNKNDLLKISYHHKLDFLNTTLESIDRIASELQDLIMRIRMVPLEQVFNRFPRLVRDLAKKGGKKVNFIMKGGEVRVNRNVLVEIGEPILHLLRNAVDHGIEPPEVRSKNGKPEEGVIRLIAERKGDKVIITVEDDGAGIDPEKIKRKALEKGIISKTEANTLSARQLIDLIFLPGFSTAEKITETSGRGVGMDIVKTRIKSLGGTVNIESTVGKGTKITLTLYDAPLKLTIVKAILIKVLKQIYAIPLNLVVEAIDVRREEIKKLGKGEMINVRGRIVPLFQLRELLGLPKTDYNKCTILIIERKPCNFGVIVDSIVDMREIVVRKLDSIVKGIRGIKGATILENGQVILILDPTSLLDKWRQREIEAFESSIHAHSTESYSPILTS
ncbi:chemotaxis protein CheA [Candidatus Bathyarchaeota archaeon]|nr:chemotaxis protein CheA [Candidatus Bathyarchaeota archaeon]